MFCQNCGASLDDDAVFCSSCGTKTDAAAPAKSEMPKAVPTAPVKEKRKTEFHISVAAVAIVVEMILFIALIRGVGPSVKASFSAEAAAEKYFVSIVNGDYEQAYKMLDLPEGEFLSEEAFQNYCRQNNFENITSYQVMVGDMDDFFDFDEENMLGQKFEIRYRNRGEYSDGYLDVDVVKGPGKKYLFFDNWIIDYSSMIKSDFTVRAAKGASVMLDGVVLNENYRTKEKGDWEEYTIPAIFCGTHVVDAALEGRDPRHKIFDAGYGSVDASRMRCDEQTAKEIMALAYENMAQIYAAAQQGKPFEEIKDLFVTDEDMLSNSEGVYNDLLAYFSGNNRPISIKTGDIQGEVTAEMRQTKVKFSYDYDLAYYTQDWWTSEKTKQNYEGYKECFFEYVPENGKWLINYLGCDRFYEFSWYD